MADRIKGITVEIGGDTTGLSKALSGVNKEIRNTQSQLTDVNRLLKLDPTNSELLSQKQKLLSQAVGETKEKLTVFAAAGGWLGYFLGGCDGLLYALLNSFWSASQTLSASMCSDKSVSCGRQSSSFTSRMNVCP